MEYGIKCYWRFRGDRAYRIGYPYGERESAGLIRMGNHNGDPRGVIVDLKDIEIKEQ